MLGIVMPVWLTDVEVLWESTRKATESVDVDATLTVIPNRLHRTDEAGLCQYLQPPKTNKQVVRVQVLPWDGARSVAASWNQGIKAAMNEGCDRFLIMANDCYWYPGAIQKLIEYGDSPESRNTMIWSGYCFKGGEEFQEPRDGCDFTGFMIRKECIEQVGWFDEHYRPAYFEDNDYATRVVLSGYDCRVIPSSRFDTPGSLTIRSDSEAAHHVGYWFDKNRARFREKWGTDRVPVSAEDCLSRCFRHPWNNASLPVSFWERP